MGNCSAARMNACFFTVGCDFDFYLGFCFFRFDCCSCRSWGFVVDVVVGFPVSYSLFVEIESDCKNDVVQVIVTATEDGTCRVAQLVVKVLGVLEESFRMYSSRSANGRHFLLC